MESSAGLKNFRKVDSTKRCDDAHKLPEEGDPNSVLQNFKDGKLTSERYYDENGKAYLDIDYPDHGNPKWHPDVPYEHPITFEDGHFHRGAEGGIE